MRRVQTTLLLQRSRVVSHWNLSDPNRPEVEHWAAETGVIEASKAGPEMMRTHGRKNADCITSSNGPNKRDELV